jgi:hypothetical protein
MYTDTLESFASNARDVERLIDFDREVIELMIMSLNGLKNDVPPQLHSFANRIDRTVLMMKGIRSNDSLKETLIKSTRCEVQTL